VRLLYKDIIEEMKGTYSDKSKWMDALGTDEDGVKKLLLYAATGRSVITTLKML
jgi:hypothetical protein